MKKNWNKGLTKETHLSILKASEKKKGQVPWNKDKKISEQTKQKISKTMREVAARRNYTQGRGSGKKGYYNNIYCDSQWELAYVIYCLDHNITIERNEKGFTYIYENIARTYYPDFYLPSTNTYIEIKGYIRAKDICKINQFTKNLMVIYYKDIKKYLDYVTKKYMISRENIYTLYTLSLNTTNQINQKTKHKKKSRYTEKLIQNREIRKELILQSNIDFTKFGWVEKLSKILKISPQKISPWLKKHMPDFYNTFGFKRK